MGRPRSKNRVIAFLHRHKLGLLGAVPGIVVVPMITLMASLGPDDVSRNLAKWPAAIGLNDLAEWVEHYATGPRVFWATAIFCLVYGAVVWGLPALIYRTKRQTAVILVPISTLIIIAVVGLGAFIIGHTKLVPASPSIELSDQQIYDFLSAVKKSGFKLENHGVVHVYSTCGNTPQRYASRIAEMLSAANIMRMYQRGYCTPHDISEEHGLLISLQEFRKPSEEAARMMELLSASKIPFTVSRVIYSNLKYPYFALNVVDR